MARLAIFTMGTRGDIQPYIYLAQSLEEAGHDIFIGSHPCWRTLIETAKIAFEPVGPDIDIEAEAALIRGKTRNPALSMLRTMNFVFRIIQNATGDVYALCQNRDLIIVSHSQMGASEAEALGIPRINVTLQPEMVAEKLKPKTWIQTLIGQLIGAQMVKPYNNIRKVYGLPKLKSSDDLISKRLNLLPISPHVLPRNPYWEQHHQLTGYWYREETGYQSDPALVQFLEGGQAPLLLALGAMSFESEKEAKNLQLFLDAFRETGMRAIIQGFQKSMNDIQLPEGMLAAGSIPHSWLFPRCFGVIHHCGFGTATATLIYGVPSIPVPHVLDQQGMAKQLFSLGASTEIIPAGVLSVERVTRAIMELQNNYAEKKKVVTKLSRELRGENGLATAVVLIEEVLSEVNSTSMPVNEGEQVPD